LALGFSVKQRLRRLAFSLRPRLATESPTGSLSSAELTTLISFGEVLVDSRDLTDEEKDYLRQHIDDRTRNDRGYLSLYRRTSSLLDKLAGKEFSKLPRENRSELLREHRLISSSVSATECLLPFNREKLTVRTLAVPDLLAGYYRSPAGWAVVGYESFPGRCGELSRYVRPERI